MYDPKKDHSFFSQIKTLDKLKCCYSWNRLFLGVSIFPNFNSHSSFSESSFERKVSEKCAVHSDHDEYWECSLFIYQDRLYEICGTPYLNCSSLFNKKEKTVSNFFGKKMEQMKISFYSPTLLRLHLSLSKKLIQDWNDSCWWNN